MDLLYVKAKDLSFFSINKTGNVPFKKSFLFFLNRKKAVLIELRIFLFLLNSCPEVWEILVFLNYIITIGAIYLFTFNSGLIPLEKAWTSLSL